MLNSKPFSGTNVFMSRKLVPPELFDTLQDALKLNGAEVFLCCDPSRSAPTDYHVISSAEHEKFQDLQTKGCQLIGPQCVLSCAKERRALPTQGFTCCLAMDGVKLLVSGFDANEKETVTKLVTAMRGTIVVKASSDVNFVVAKNVLATKYKWAVNISKKPIVSISWVYQCWKEHRLVPQEQYKIPPFSGLMICVTGIPSGERKVMEQLILQNGGKYSAELTKMCTHLISETPEGDKYKVAQRWGHINIVTRKWFDQSIARRACINEESYPVQGASLSSINPARTSFLAQHSQDTTRKTSQSSFSSAVADSAKQSILYADLQNQELKATLSQNLSFKDSDYSDFLKDDGKPSEQSSELRVDGCVADDSQSEDNDLYLSECRILFVGFGASDLRKLVSTVRKGGGSRYMSINNGLTHIVIGNPSETEKKEIRDLTASGVINVVRANWLEDCDRLKKEMPVLPRHTGHELLLPQGSIVSNAVVRQLNNSKTPSMPLDQNKDNLKSSSVLSFGTRKRDTFEIVKGIQNHTECMITVEKHSRLSSANEVKGLQKVFLGVGNPNQQAKCSSTVFKGKQFSFSRFFPEERKTEIVQWINQGGGVIMDEEARDLADFTVECHGVVPKFPIATGTISVSSHWIMCCLKDARLLDVGSHILYSPLHCDIPLPGFGSFRFCISQYDVKERLLLKNLCHTLGAKYSDKLTKKVTHLLCKFSNGPKYEAACSWGIQAVTSEWIHECVQKNRAVPVDLFGPKEASTQDLEAVKECGSQYPTQVFQMLPGENSSRCSSQRMDYSKASTSSNLASDLFREEEEHLISKRARLREDGQTSSDSFQVPHKASKNREHSVEKEKLQSTCNASRETPEIADAIEVLLEETSKIIEVPSPERTNFDENQFTSECQEMDRQPHQATLNPVFGSSSQQRSSEREDEIQHSAPGDLTIPLPAKDESRSSPVKNDQLRNISKDVKASIYDGFSETQTESQVVGYEEDLSGRQMIIDRILSRSSLT